MTSGIEETAAFTPRFNADGLIPCIVVSAVDGAVLMMAWMNTEALDLTRTTGRAHYWSRSRQELWRKGATSGQEQRVVSLHVDCDQDCLLLRVEMPLGEGGAETACHTGRRGCFYRRVGAEGRLLF